MVPACLRLLKKYFLAPSTRECTSTGEQTNQFKNNWKIISLMKKVSFFYLSVDNYLNQRPIWDQLRDGDVCLDEKGAARQQGGLRGLWLLPC